MKSISLILTLSALLSAVPVQVQSASASNEPFCYMQMSEQIVDLTSLCMDNGDANVFAVPAMLAVNRRCDDFASWEEAQYHYMMGFATSELDADLDGIACEVLPQNSPQREGYRSNRISLGGYGYSIVQSPGQFFIEATWQGRPVFSTAPFSSQSEAEQYARRYIPANSPQAEQILQVIWRN